MCGYIPIKCWLQTGFRRQVMVRRCSFPMRVLFGTLVVVGTHQWRGQRSLHTLQWDVNECNGYKDVKRLCEGQPE